ncbi:M4 family metallopeptidase [Aurantibacter crassamenti]|uniref:M4 family metallopeptidase n=1 Tax=Aurantibacter crassamenti TaxID=1837375 RepID=UPI00193A9589|nr:M4 family metallopeptidase [Aurantibacter crassamenti]MBM1105598.1 M4 family metallopeptidase [Aurantibacter crassamenti]
MQRKLQILTFVFCTFLTLTITAQDTFDDKKHQKGTSAKAGMVKKFKTLQIAKDKNEKSLKTGRTNFQMPSVFNRGSIGSKYEHQVLNKTEKGLPLFIKSEANQESVSLIGKQSVENVAKDYLVDVKHLLQINDPTSEFVEISSKIDGLGQTHIKMQQVFQGVKVHGSEVVLHLDKSKKVSALNGRNQPTPIINNTVPKLSITDALKQVEIDLGVVLNQNSSAKNNSFLTDTDFEEELLIYPFEGEYILARHLTVYPNLMDRWEYFVDAQTGRILNKYYHTCTFYNDLKKENHSHSAGFTPPSNGNGNDLNGVNRQLNTYNIEGVNYLINTSESMFNAAQSELPDNPVGAIVTFDLKNEAPVEGVTVFHVTSTSNNWNNPTAVSAHYNAEVSYEYFKNTFNRNSINGQGGTIISFINVAANDGGGYDNAFWNGKAIFYGNGKVAFSPFAGSLDVSGHEMSHGVIGATANLEYLNQSGAINESFADIFGTMIDRDDWLLGEDIVNRDYFASGAMRDMQNPNNGVSSNETGWQPKDMTEYYTGSEDNGGVHLNSGIVNRAYYLVATDISKNKAEQIYYRALETYLTVSSQFIDLRLAVIQSAIDLHGDNSPEVIAVKNAFDTVGITDGEGTDIDKDIPIANGDDFILSLDIDEQNPNTLYVSDTEATEFLPLTTTRIFRKPSVADDGSFAIYVTENNTVNAISLDLNNVEETVISEEPIWAAVSLSKDGTKLAAVLNDQSNVIFISDLVNGDSRSFELYNPTSADGVTTGEVLYPDALEWDYSGQYLIYDALNSLQNSDGQNIEYWDVGAMKVWDNQSNSYANGSIQKIFTNLPEGVSIGNPSFSKTSGNILAFDYFDTLNGVYEVITANIETGEVKTVYENNKLGFPNYSKTDDKIIFDTFNGTSEDILAINIAADKISPSGNASGLIPDGKWGVWYTVGSRSTLSSEKEITDFRFNITSPPTVASISGNVISVNLPNNINPGNLIATFANSASATVSISGVNQQSGATANDFSNSVVYTVTAEDGSTKNFTVNLGEGIPNNPNDDDNDGVLNADDQCPNTPFGAAVDVAGCPIFSLPNNNFSVAAKDESCIDSNNGSITIAAQANYNYTATLTGSAVSKTDSFTSSVSFSDLESGSYVVCITVQGETGYESCFDVNISEPEALSVSSKINLSAKSVQLNLSGADEYVISFNDEVIVTSKSELTIPLRASMTKLTVKTDKICQGLYEENFDLNDVIIVYPNPVKSGEISVALGKTYEKSVPIQLNTFDGRLVLQKNIAPNTSEIKLDAESLTAGVYVLSVQVDGEARTFKIIKQ